ncbi:hypothetical protein CO613_04085 [Lysobacteraceae bacterium NML07-0707]|nr:hypothetical protein CO613_04085 [Xanthomonadaceae bacterium NML07-0707]
MSRKSVGHYTRAHRLLQLLELLRARRRPMPGQQLAEVLGISQRGEGAMIEG